ncbi:hypothetical protein ABW19_dt0201730 [Dactylella cylindrospora]|nr:hypothetical protein ABW19_dt0201730 [Dactylella cylindrospora]
MANDSYDEDLAEAIRRSLLDQEDSGPSEDITQKEIPTATTQKKQPIIILDDSEDDVTDVKGKESKKAIKKEEQKQETKKEEVKQEEKKPIFTMLGLNRAQMERERVARLKRKEIDDGQASVPQAKYVKSIETPSFVSASKEQPASSTVGPSKKSPFMTLRDLQERVANYVPRSTQYFDGVVKKTYIQGRERTPDDIKLEEVLQKDTLQSAVLSAYVWEFLWVLQKLKVGESDLVLVLHAPEDTVRTIR